MRIDSSVAAFTVLLLGFGHPPDLAAVIDIQGLDPETVYTAQVRFRITPEAGSRDVATLNGRSAATDDWITVTAPDYYELIITREAAEAGNVEERTIQFIVRDPARGNSEWGLRPWTPAAVVNGAAEEFTGSHLRLVAPAAWPAGLDMPLVAWIETATGDPVRANGRLVADGFAPLQIRRGVGSVLSPGFAGGGDLTWRPRLHDLVGDRFIAIESTVKWAPVSGSIELAATWPTDSRIRVDADLMIPSGSSLTIEAGSIVQMVAGAEWHIDGTLTIEGTPERPVVLTPESSTRPWGGIVCRNPAARVVMRHTILTGSGADPDWFDNHPGSGSSHRHEQPALYLGAGAEATLDHCYLIDNRGQAAHGEDAILTMDGCLVQRCITAGQFNGGEVLIRRSALLEFPIDDETFADDDNDGLYLTDGTHRLVDSLLGWAKDDGIDSGSGGGGSVAVERCWIEACFHEGLAWSGTDRVARTSDTVVIDCGQGIEAGFSDSNGSPDVGAERCLILANGVGARFGDNYDWSYDGFLRVQNSLLLHNRRDVWGLNWDDWTYRTGQMDIRDNWFGTTNAHHPENEVFSADVDTARLNEFLPRTDRVGVSIALNSGQATAADLAEGVPVRLSRWAAAPTEVHWKWSNTAGARTEGLLEFAPGEIQRHLPLPATPATSSWVLQLTATDSAEPTTRSLLLVSPGGNARVGLVHLGASWRYLDDGSDQGRDWREPEFDDSQWAAGPAQLGYGDGDEATVIAGGPSDARHATTYFRHAFEAPDPATFTSLEIGVQRDDGAIVWLNGREVFRTNMPEGEVSADVYTGRTTDSESTFYTAPLEPDALVPGRNVLAVEVHQAGPSSSDLSFDLWLTGHPWPRLFWLRSGGQVLLHWPSEALRLETAPNLDGAWTPVLEANSPFLAPPEARFYRLRGP